MSEQSSMPSGHRVLPPLDLRGTASSRQTVLLAARSAFASLGVHKLRAALTMVGIIVGVAGVFTIVNLASLARAENTRGIGGLGANVIQVNGFAIPSTAPPPPGSGKVAVMFTGAPSLTAADVQALQKLPHVIAVSPQIGNQLQVQAADRNWNTQVFGTYPDMQIILGANVQQGGFFTQVDVTSGNTVAVLGQTVAKQLFPNGNAVGQQVRIGDVEFSVVGVLKPLGTNGNQDMDDVVAVPASTFLQRLMGSGQIRMTTGNAPKLPPPDVTVIQGQGSGDKALMRTNFPDVRVAVDDPKNVETIQTAITQTLRQMHGIKPGSEDDFTVGGFLKGVVTAQQGSTTILWIMGSIAAVVLLIGGFGVANVMLAAVSERRTEIGVRLAVGARIEDIFWQFLLEALTLSVAGGVLGVLGGVTLSLTLPLLTPQFARLGAAPSWLEMATALVAAIAIGLAFGAYPARRAARTDPIQVLRRG